MKNPVVRLKLRVHLPDGSRPYLDPIFAANGKLKPGHALLDGSPTHFPEDVYHLRYLGNLCTSFATLLRLIDLIVEGVYR